MRLKRINRKERTKCLWSNKSSKKKLKIKKILNPYYKDTLTMGIKTTLKCRSLLWINKSKKL